MKKTVLLLMGLLGLPVVFSSCGVAYKLHRRPQVSLPSIEAIPEVEKFEPILEQKGRLIEALFAIDQLVEPESELASARKSFGDLLETTRPLVEKALPVSGAYGAALEVLGKLRVAGFQYQSDVEGLSHRYGSISKCLQSHRGICLSFTLLTMALLDACGVDSFAVTYPQHVLVRIRKEDREIELESTVFGDPVVSEYPGDLMIRAAKEGLIYGRSLDRTAAVWLYLEERLWVWVLRRAKDPHSFVLLERAEDVLKGFDDSLSFQWALRHHLRSANTLCSQAERAESFTLAVGEFERLIRWDPTRGTSYLHLSTLYEQAGMLKPALETLKRFMDTKPDEDEDVFVQAWWWIKRKELNLDGFRLTQEEIKRSEEYLEHYFPIADRPQRLKYLYHRLFEGSGR
jgi:regulator of sirC expression with transglutaminase-like and TPR domain